jgi:hypothetical protein
MGDDKREISNQTIDYVEGDVMRTLEFTDVRWT